MHPRHTPSIQAQHFEAGFTTIELMVVVAIVATLAALAGPSFTLLIENWRVRESAELLQDTLVYARSEAIKRGGHVVVQKLPNNTNGCSTADETSKWNCGWMVCHDTNDSGTCTAADPVLQRVASSAKVEVRRTRGGESIKLNRWGLVSGSWPGFNLVPLNKTISYSGALGVCMNSGGRVRIISQEALPCTN
ncbi:MAG: GspH/FimT family pseudopilin [Acidovorax sp.]|uniref:GspH/FimT family pseudopilin n=1 Tax=Acidovorax sp. TaxID=1872122 RepID=UPI0025BAB81F|nr:GspH/FimT family pseudopilin [Acidovorax sp.]MCE1192348.1 GspH/FimT family pseudopilin [Acidovorax sp.]